MSIISFTSILGVTVGIASGIIKKLLSITRNKKKIRDKILLLAKTELNSIETLVFQPLIGIEISHGEFDTIMKEKKIREDERKCEECK